MPLGTSATLTAAGARTIAVLTLPSMRRIRPRCAEAGGAAERALRAASDTMSAAMTLSASTRSIAIEFATATAGARELRRLPFRGLSLRTRKRCANQPTMHRAVVFGRVFVSVILILGNSWHFLSMLNDGFFGKRRLLYLQRVGERFGRRCLFLWSVFGD